MHLIHQNIPGLCWGDPAWPPIFETNTSRKRLNILGAYDPATFNFIHLTGEENCNADRAIEFFEIIRQKYPNASKIYLILDNAKYFLAKKKVREWLENKPLIIKYLPPYSPNLNLIERFWKFTKEKLVVRKYYKKDKTFRAKTFRILNNVKDHIDELKTLMTEKFQIITQ
ncbi:hypothetical protein GMMP15_1230001 [Candidatus Magnetomoraceae bacterium gMMP-15]